MSNISDMVLKKEAAWKDEDYRNAAMNIALPVGGAAAGYGLTNALVDDASTGMKIGGAGLGAAAALITSLYLQNMDKGTVPADVPPVKPSEKAEQELKDVASDWSPRGAMGTALGVGAAGTAGALGTYGAYKGIKGALKGVGSVIERAGNKAGQGATTLIGKGTTIAGKGISDTAKTAYDAISGKSVKDALDATRAAGKETTEGIWNLKGLLKLIKKVKKVAP
ncbi:MAG: hypothetical protein WC910_09055 [Bacteroidales bacterium]|jgi:hypothetical protein